MAGTTDTRGPAYQPPSRAPRHWGPLGPPDVVDGRAQVMGPVRKGTVWPVLGAVALGVRLVDADARLVVAQVVAALRVSRGPVQEWAPAAGPGLLSPPGEVTPAGRWHPEEILQGA